jgi:4-amino-4-deoxy-L-arabinose transferase-like glycosyltransferase
MQTKPSEGANPDRTPSGYENPGRRRGARSASGHIRGGGESQATGHLRIAFRIFLVTFGLLFLLHGNRFAATNDEGILLEPARQLVAGARPYVDFFGYMSPGSYWIQAVIFKIFGVSYWAGRLPVLLDLSLQCALLFWLTARLASRRAAWAAMAVFTGFQIADPSFLTAQHRWDSGTLALAGLCVAVVAVEPHASLRSIRWMISGAFLAAAAWCTPSMAFVAAVEAAWLLSSADRRKGLVPFAAGVVGLSALAAAQLARQGALDAFVHQMLWLQKNYASVNVMGYGSVIGGYGKLLEGTSGPEAALRILLVFCLTLPAILPPLSAGLWIAMLARKMTTNRQRAALLLLIPASAALTATAFPRADIMHLSFVVALPYALAAAALARMLTVRAGAILSFTIIPFAVLFSMNSILGWFATKPIETPTGRIRVAKELAPAFDNLFKTVQPGDSLYVYPYMPVHYFLTQAENPTRFSFLAPGMMTGTEEAEALKELHTHPPEWLLYMPLTRDEFTRVFPNATDLSQRFESLEGWLDRNYAPVDSPAINLGGYRLMRRVPRT